MALKIRVDWTIDDFTMAELLRRSFPEVREVVELLLNEQEDDEDDEDDEDEDEDWDDDPSHEVFPGEDSALSEPLSYLDAATGHVVLTSHVRWNRPGYEAHHGHYPEGVASPQEAVDAWRGLIVTWATNFRPEAPFEERDPDAPDLAKCLKEVMGKWGPEVQSLVRQRGGLTYAVAWGQDPEEDTVDNGTWDGARLIAENIAQVCSVLGYGLDATLEYGTRRLMAEKIPNEGA